MKYVDEYRGADEAQKFVAAIERLVTRPWNLMEICGGQTHTMIKAGIDQMLPPEVTMIHGPGCPVCVTPLELIDRALA
ncbi:MAG: hydrogenase formation protein HypD, partial [Thermoanaerobaculia bacterium]